MTRKLTITALVAGTVFSAAVSSAWAKPKTQIVVEVVSIAVALSHSPSYHPAIPDTSTTVCTPSGEKCATTTTPGYPASLDNLEYYSQFIYAIMPDGQHVTLRYSGSRVVYPPQPGDYTAETNGSKVLLLDVSYVDGKSGKLKYRIEGTW
jgi:hypothetical protein